MANWKTKDCTEKLHMFNQGKISYFLRASFGMFMKWFDCLRHVTTWWIPFVFVKIRKINFLFSDSLTLKAETTDSSWTSVTLHHSTHFWRTMIVYTAVRNWNTARQPNFQYLIYDTLRSLRIYCKWKLISSLFFLCCVPLGRCESLACRMCLL